jgi:hemoglobin
MINTDSIATIGHPRTRISGWKPLAAMCVLALSLSGAGVAAAADDAALYHRLGGQAAVQAVVNGLVDRIIEDTRVNRWFAHTAATPENIASYKARLYQFVCQASGGPCTYAGRDMVVAHRGRAVTSEAFDAVVEDLVSVLDTLKVPEKEKGDLLRVLGPLKRSIVQP